VSTLTKFRKKHGKPVVLQVDGDWVEAMIKSQPVTRFFKPLMKAWVKKMFHTADKLVVVSNSLKERITNEYNMSSEGIIVNPNGVNKKLFEKRRFSKRFNKTSPVVVFLGTMGSWYDLHTLIRSIKLLKDSGINVRCELVLAGLDYWPKLSHELFNLIKSLELKGVISVKREVPHEEVPSVLSRADVLVAPYFRNAYGFSPLKLFEYMIMKKPIVSSDVKEVREVITHEKEGLLVPPESCEELAKAIKKIVNDSNLRKKLSIKAYHKVIKNYTWKQHAQRFKKVYEELLRA